MSIVALIVVLILIGAGLYALNHVEGIDPKIKALINVVVIVLVCLWLLDVFVGFGPRVGHIYIR